MYFRQATIATPQCTPSRASLLTGVFAHTHGKYSNQYWRPDVETTEGFKIPMLPTLLRDAGYRTLLVGKWHLFHDPWNCGVSDVRLWFPPGGGVKQDPRLARGNSRKTEVKEGFITELFANDTIAFLKSAEAKEKPFFLWHADTNPHVPLEPMPERISRQYGEKTDKDLLPPGFPTDIPTHNFRKYYECATHLDEQVGRILKALEDEKLAENTIVVYLGDNGFMMGSRGVGVKGAGGKVVPYEESIRVPMIVRMPGGWSGTSDLPVSSIDLPVTFLKLAGVEPPKGWPGRDLSVALRSGKDDAIADALVDFPDNQGKLNRAYRVVRTPKHKLIVWDDPKKVPELYDLASDPREMKNRYESSELAEVRKDLIARLRAWTKKTDDKLFVSNQHLLEEGR
jgi:N-acetylglucosamine-6-sulfatase